MTARFVVRLIHAGFLFALAYDLHAQDAAESNDPKVLIERGNEALARNKLHDAAIAFQRAIDINPSSAKAHEQLGVTLTREIVEGNIRPSADSDILQRAEDNLRRAMELAPSSIKPIDELAALETALAERSSDAGERADRYRDAEELLKQVLALEPGTPGMYLRLASLERDEFSPAIQQAKSRAGAKAGPLIDSELRHALQQQYGNLINDAIANAQRAAQMNGDSPKPLLLMSRLLEERALLRDTLEEYTSDMHQSEDWQRQFLSIGNHAALAK